MLINQCFFYYREKEPANITSVLIENHMSDSAGKFIHTVIRKRRL